jgi:hypothetical protein
MFRQQCIDFLSKYEANIKALVSQGKKKIHGSFICMGNFHRFHDLICPVQEQQPEFFVRQFALVNEQ